jgi:hypothetical protein
MPAQSSSQAGMTFLVLPMFLLRAIRDPVERRRPSNSRSPRAPRADQPVRWRWSPRCPPPPGGAHRPAARHPFSRVQSARPACLNIIQRGHPTRYAAGSIRALHPAMPTLAQIPLQLLARRYWEMIHRPLPALQPPQFLEASHKLLLPALDYLGCPLLLAQHLCSEGKRRDAAPGGEVGPLLGCEVIVCGLRVLCTR